VRPTIDKSEKGQGCCSQSQRRVPPQRQSRGCAGSAGRRAVQLLPHIVCSLIGSCESKVGHSIRSPMRQSDTLRCDPMQRSSWPIPLRPADTDSRPRIKCCVRSSTDAADTSGGNSWALVDTGSEYSFLVSADNWARWQWARVMHCAAAIEQVRRTFRALPLCAWLHIEMDNAPRSFRVPGIPMRGHQHSRLCDILGIAPIAEHGLTVNDGAWSFYLE